MSGLKVSLEPATRGGRLYPSYDTESEILILESEIERPWPHGVDVNGLLVFDLDKDRILSNVDLHVPRSLWKSGLHVKSPRTSEKYDVRFNEQTVAEKSFDLAVDVMVDKRNESVVVSIGGVTAQFAVTLSENCSALIANGELVGFYVQGIV